jgi:hypothetical protein
MKKLFCFFTLMFGATLVFAQEINPDRTFVNNFYDAEAYMYEKNFDAALELLLKLE